MVRVEADDPRRCHGKTAQGQCQIRALDGSVYCAVHNGPIERVQAKEAARNYRLQQFRERVSEFADNDQVKSLREEIGILRLMMETIINRCEDANQLIIYSNKIADMTTRIEKLVVSCHRLEERTGMLLDKSAIIQLAGVIVEIIGRHDIPEDILQAISEEILQEIQNTHVAKIE